MIDLFLRVADSLLDQLVLNSLSILAVSSLLALGSEILLRFMSPGRGGAWDLSRRTGLDPGNIAPIGDSLQLWTETRPWLDIPHPASQLPNGSPAHIAAHVLNVGGDIFLLLLLDTRRMDPRPDPEDPGSIDFIGGQSCTIALQTTPVLFPYTPVFDCARLTDLVSIQARRFGHDRPVVPLLYNADPDAPRPEEDDVLTENGFRVVDLSEENFRNLGQRLAALAAPGPAWAFLPLRKWLARQPARTTPQPLLLARLVFVLGFGMLMLQAGRLPRPEDLLALVGI